MQCFARVLSLLLTAVAASSSWSSAQTFMQAGNVLHLFGGDTVALLDTGLQTNTPLQLVPNGVAIQRFVWNPSSPDELIVSGTDNLFYRATVTGPGPGVTVAQIPVPAIANVRQLSWLQNGDLLVAGEANGNLLWRVDLTTNTTTALLSWPSLGVTCGIQDPNTGDFYLGGSAGVHRVTGVPTGTPSVTLVAPSPTPVRSLAFDPLQPQWLLFTYSQDLFRVDVTTGGVDTIWDGVPRVDLIRNGIAGEFRAIRSRNVYGIDNPAVIPAGGVPPQLLGANTNVGCCALIDACVVGADVAPFRLDIDSSVGCAATFSIRNPPVGTSSAWMFFSGTTTFAHGTGPFFGLMPDGVTLVMLQATMTAQPGSFLHSLGAPPPLTNIPPGVLCFLSGQTWDVVVAAWGPALQFAGRSNVVRLTWQ